MTFKVKDGLSLGQTTIIDALGNVTVPAALNVNSVGGILVGGTTSGSTKIIATATPANTLVLPTGNGTFALVSDLPVVNNGTLTLASSGNGVSGSGSFTANQSGNTTVTFTSNATNANTAQTIVFRDASGNFSAGTITAALSGNASTVTNGVYTTGSYTNPAWITSIDYSKLTGTIPTWNQNTTGNATTATRMTVNSATDANAVRSNALELFTNTAGSTNFPTTAGITLEARRATGSASACGTFQLFSRGDDSYQIRTVTGYTTSDTWSSWKTILHSGNFNTYSPTLTGTGASGLWDISISGSAPTLTTARTINGTSFNGSANITTVTWGTARTLTIGSSAKAVDGTTNVGWSLAEMGAAATNQTMNIGTTAVAINRASLAQTLTGVDINGNANTATTLQTARNINGTSFNGSAAITTATWGTSRTLTMGSSAKAVDGSGNVSWSLAEMGAAAVGQTMNIGTTAVAINRASASQTLNGVSIDGNAATSAVAAALQTSRTINGASFNGTANIEVTEWFHSGRDFTNGTLIRTDINYGVQNGDAWVLEIKGNSYGSLTPFDIQYQGYIYGDTIQSHGGYSNGTNVSGIVALNAGGQLCFWIPYDAYWQGYNVKAYTAFTGRAQNRVYALENLAKPVGTKEVALQNIVQSVHSGNYTQYLPSMTGTGASGLWGISVTGNAATSTTLQTPRTMWGQSFNGSANISGALSQVTTIGMSGQLTSTLASGTAPLVVQSTTVVQNLNADLLDGLHATSLNTASTVVARDVSNNFAAGTITAALSGNATTATTLQTARNINGTSFNGSADITTANWGTARTLTIGGTGKSVNGSAAVSWSIAEVMTGATNLQSAGHSNSWGTTNAANTGGFNTTMGTGGAATWLLSGSSAGVFRAGIQSLDSDGTLRFYQGANFFTFGSNTVTANAFSGTFLGNASTVTDGMYIASDQIVTGTKRFPTDNTSIANASGGAKLEVQSTGGAAFMQFHRPGVFAANFGLDSDNQFKVGGWAMGAVQYVLLHSGNYNTYAPTLTGTGASGANWNISVLGSAATLTTPRAINGTSFNGSAAITTATWGTARTLTVGSTGKSVDGSGNVSWQLGELGAQAALGYTPVQQGGGGGQGNGKIYIGWGNTGNQLRLHVDSTDFGGTWPINISGTASGQFPVSGGVISGGVEISKQTTVAVGGGHSPQFVIGNAGSGPSVMSFLRSGAYAINIGLDTDNVFRIGGYSDGTNIYRLQSDTAGNLTIRGQITAGGNVTAYSDERLKTNWGALSPDFIDRISEVKYGTYEMISTGVKSVGVSAQSLREVLPEAVQVADDELNTLSVAYGNAAMVTCIELAKEIKQLKLEIEKLRGNN